MYESTFVLSYEGTKVLSYFRTTLLRVQLYSVQLYTAIEYVSCTLYMYNNTKVPSKIEYFRKYESTFESKILSYESTKYFRTI